MSRNEIRQHYIYFGNTNKIEVVDSTEGKLHWILKNDLLHKDYTTTFEKMLKHYMSTGQKNNFIYCGIVVNDNEQLNINWSILEDTERLN